MLFLFIFLDERIKTWRGKYLSLGHTFSNGKSQDLNLIHLTWGPVLSTTTCYCHSSLVGTCLKLVLKARISKALLKFLNWTKDIQRSDIWYSHTDTSVRFFSRPQGPHVSVVHGSLWAFTSASRGCIDSRADGCPWNGRQDWEGGY